MQTRLSSLEELHSRNWLQAKHRVVLYGGEKGSEGGGWAPDIRACELAVWVSTGTETEMEVRWR